MEDVTLKSHKIHFAVMALEAGAQKNEHFPERAFDVFYTTNVCKQLHDSRYGLHLMSDIYIVNDVLNELREKQS